MKLLRLTFSAALTIAAVPVTAQDAVRGEDLYRAHCATCHGIDMHGQGPMAGVLLVQPSDLTALAANNNGVFPTERVVRRIDGRDPLVSHGSQMPVYGPFFEGEDIIFKMPDGQPIMTSVPIADLLAYLTSLQSDEG